MSKFKQVLGAIGKWLRENWLPLLLVVAIAALFVKGCERTQAYDSLFEQYQQQSKDHQQQIRDLQALQERERQELDRQLQKYFKEMDRIEREYKEEIQRISVRTETRRVRIIHDYSRDPTALTTAVRDTFGIPVEE